jgi:predicted SnoaL-like aldol condensation-catalyzing enzyme
MEIVIVKGGREHAWQGTARTYACRWTESWTRRVRRARYAERGSKGKVNDMNPDQQTLQDDNKALVLGAFDTLFNKRDFGAAEKLWSPSYIQHSAHIPPGRGGLFDLVRNAPPEMRYENGLVFAAGDLVILHGRFSNIGQPANWVVADIVRVEKGRLAEHWDVIQDEATKEQSKSGLPMFGDEFPR